MNLGGYETKPATFPTFSAKGVRIVLSYNGSYANLKQQLYEGLSRATWHQGPGRHSFNRYVRRKYI